MFWISLEKVPRRFIGCNRTFQRWRTVAGTWWPCIPNNHIWITRRPAYAYLPKVQGSLLDLEHICQSCIDGMSEDLLPKHAKMCSIGNPRTVTSVLREVRSSRGKHLLLPPVASCAKSTCNVPY
jgi:hypothetical protein